MSRSVDLFIASPQALGAVAETVGKLTGFRVSPGEGESWVVQDGDVHAVLGEHCYPDDGELPLSRYRYAISARVPDTVRPQDSAPAALLRQVAHKLQGQNLRAQNPEAQNPEAQNPEAQNLRADNPPWMVLMVLDLQYKDDPTKPGPKIERAPEFEPASEPESASEIEPAAATSGTQ